MQGSLRPWRNRTDALLAARASQENAERYFALAKQHREAGNEALANGMQRIASAYRASASQYELDAERLRE